MKTMVVEVRILDSKTKEFLDSKSYRLEMPEAVKSEDYDEIFDALFKFYPEDFPAEEPGVDVEIENIYYEEA